MRRLFLCLLCASALAACTAPAPDALPPASVRAVEWQAWKAAKDALFRAPGSPLLPSQQAAFDGLSFFPYDSTLAFAVTLDPALGRDTLRLATSTGEPREVIRFGTFSFLLGERRHRLTVFQPTERDPASGQPLRLFLPLADATSGRGTYAGGRYLDLDAAADGRYVLDFNYAYNPYCVYNPRYSCPLPPAENRLTAPVRAGERAFTQP